MSDPIPLIKSHPSARVRKLLASAELDLPSAEGKGRTLAAVAAMERRETTTNFSGLALGTTVHRLLGAVTLYDSHSNPLRFVLRGSLVGVAAGALALAGVVMLRWTGAAGTDASPRPSLAQAPPQLASEQPEALRAVERELVAGHSEHALALVRAFVAANPDSKARQRAIVLEAKCLVGLGRIGEAEHVAEPLLSAGPSAEGAELRALFAAHRSAPAANPAR